MSTVTSPTDAVFATSDDIEGRVKCPGETSVDATDSEKTAPVEVGLVGAVLGAGALAL